MPTALNIQVKKHGISSSFIQMSMHQLGYCRLQALPNCSALNVVSTLGVRLNYTISNLCCPNVVNILHFLSQCWALHQD